MYLDYCHLIVSIRTGHGNRTSALDCRILRPFHRHGIHSPCNVTNDRPPPAFLRNEERNLSLTGAEDHDRVNKLVGVIRCEDDWTIPRNVVSPNNLHITKEYGKNRMKKDFDSKE